MGGFGPDHDPENGVTGSTAALQTVGAADLRQNSRIRSPYEKFTASQPAGLRGSNEAGVGVLGKL